MDHIAYFFTKQCLAKVIRPSGNYRTVVSRSCNPLPCRQSMNSTVTCVFVIPTSSTAEFSEITFAVLIIILQDNGSGYSVLILVFFRCIIFKILTEPA